MKCSLKFAPRCISNIFNKIHKSVLDIDAALKILPPLNNWLWALGVKWEQENELCEGDGSYDSNYGEKNSRFMVQNDIFEDYEDFGFVIVEDENFDMIGAIGNRNYGSGSINLIKILKITRELQKKSI